jgi:hypothetical protein
LTDSDGEITGVAGICRDITAWRKFKEDLIRVDRLAEVGRIASGIVHELNNPVAVIGEISGWIGAVASDAERSGRGGPGRNQDLGPAYRRTDQTVPQHYRSTVEFCEGIKSQHHITGCPRTSERTVNLLTPELKFTDVEIVYNFMEGPILSIPTSNCWSRFL